MTFVENQNERYFNSKWPLFRARINKGHFGLIKVSIHGKNTTKMTVSRRIARYVNKLN